MQRFSLVLSILMFSLNTYSKTKFIVCYGKFDISKVIGYDLVIVESANFNYAEIQSLKRYNKKVIAYISLGEINEDAKDYKLLKNTLGDKNLDWNSYYLDIASEKVKQVLRSRIRNIFYLGYDGLFLDNIDNYTKYGVQSNLKNNLIEFIDEIRNEYPAKVLVQNAGLELLDLLHKKIDYVLVESIFTDYDFSSQKYQIRVKDLREERLNLLKEQMVKFKIKPLILEYAIEKKTISQIKKSINKEKISFLICEISLQNLPE